MRRLAYVSPFTFVLIGLFLLATTPTESGTSLPNPATSVNGGGTMSTYSTGNRIDMAGAFFQDLGTNGRTCASCHVPSSAWGITPPEVQARFNSTNGTDPIFRTNDGANCPSADVSTVDARRSAYSMLLTKGLIRVSMSVPANADFQITAIDDPYHCPETTAFDPALYRRPLPSTNLTFLTTVMWDGRESGNPNNTLQQNLAQQAIDATMGHAQGAMPTPAQIQAIVDFESHIYTAQTISTIAGKLGAGGGNGGPENLSQQEFYVGINDALGADPTGKAFDPQAFNNYSAWLNSPNPHKAQIARGEQLFNTFPIHITGVAGLNDALNAASIPGTCTTCHDSPNVGNHSVPLAIDIGIADYPAMPALDTTGLPVYTVQCINGGQIKHVTDLGRAMVTGKCSDVGKTKGPILRGLESRAPYFHNGAAKTLADAVEFYNQRFHMNLSDDDKAALVAFLRTL
jgi:hypothetical protein